MDAATGLATRQHLLARFDRLLAEGLSPDRPVALTLANLDHFKTVNLEVGHLAADEALEEVAALFLRGAAAGDTVARIGGDLFTLLGRSDLAAARRQAEALRRAIARAAFPHGIRLTASFGVVAIDREIGFDELLRRAEACLYAAKARGRDCVVDGEEFAAEAEAGDPEMHDNENRIRVLTDRLSRAVQWRSGRLAGRFKAEAEHDGLTGLYNRRYLDRRLDREVETARKHARPLSLVFLDLDHFGEINRRYGHAGGDEALRLLAETMRESIRPVDWAARYGGEEFCLILPDTGGEAAALVAERLRTALAERSVTAADGRVFSITASLGIAELAAQDRLPADLLRRAGDRMRQAKEAGRNRVCR